MPAGSTYTPIATTTLGSAASSYTFSSIPSTYTDLILVADMSATGSSNYPSVRLNGDTASNYSRTYINGDGSSATSARNTESYMTVFGNQVAASRVNFIMHFMNYSNTTTFKTALSRKNDSASVMGATVHLWRSTAAINTILISSQTSDTFSAGSTFTLYGISCA
jgi:hypothetical protein